MIHTHGRLPCARDARSTRGVSMGTRCSVGNISDAFTCPNPDTPFSPQHDVVAIVLQREATPQHPANHQFAAAGSICSNSRYILLPRHGVCQSPSPVECDDSRRTRNLARGEPDNRATATEDKDEDSE